MKDQDVDGVIAEILYFGGPLRQAKGPGVRVNSYRGYNRWLADFSSYAPKRLLGMAAIPLDSPEIAVAEVKAAADLGLRGALLDLFPPQGCFADAQWAPLWRALIEANFPACLHVGGQRGSTLRPGPQFMAGLVVSKLQMAEAIAELIYGQVLEHHPDLRIVSVEAQIGWISFVQYYMDHLFEKHRYWTGSTLAEPPSYHYKRQVFATYMEDPVGLRERHQHRYRQHHAVERLSALGDDLAQLQVADRRVVHRLRRRGQGQDPLAERSPGPRRRRLSRARPRTPRRPSERAGGTANGPPALSGPSTA
jgi:predicted TIM-barrel fold metal-dependent hydrolase